MSQLASDTAMILAAGLGKRMRPLTASQPKPLVRVAGKALIDHALDRLKDAGIARAVVNVHYLADALEAHVLARAAPQVTVSDERALLLETGGGMVKALPKLPDPFFALNADNIWLDGPKSAFHDLSRRWNPDEMDALLLVVPHARAMNFNGPGDFHMDPLGRLSRRRAGRIAPFIYTGIQLVSHRLMRDAPQGPFSTNLLWNRAMEEGRLYGISFTGLWFEVGTPQMIRPTEEALSGG
ncbi:nucleotidyltransferase family protein [Erythrobacter sp. BLCC-B19]|uniref:nucleotidyltransferase family protein n=1 Tax=Erythrobacter sp. BLCC-B19 TaxID=3025315 RepID=UPI00235F6D87|nr:nucleotidyltransferase family protein [Erythrobacter sp. BLCC-B19]WDA40858.1 nucleotidyltransferase family protein [Erythrobacter sp. BLCC-B19]